MLATVACAVVLASGALVAARVLSGESTAAQPSIDAGELAAHAGRPCPRTLPRGEDPDGYGFGTSQPARELPALLTPERAWVCVYEPVGTAIANGTSFRWVRRTPVRPLPPQYLPAIADDLHHLDIPGGDQDCSDDLGPRRMLVLSHRGDLTGVVVDDFGCQLVRLTDEPFLTAPGNPQSEGTVPGVLAAPSDLLARLGSAR